MTTQECDSRDRRMVDKIRFVLQVNPTLKQYANNVQISIENASVVLRGQLPGAELKDQLLLAVRQAGVLDRVADFVQVDA